MPPNDSPQSPSSEKSDRAPPPTRPAPRSRLALRLIAIPVIGVIAALLYYGLQDRFFLPTCDSERAKRTLADILKQLKLEPSQYQPIKTVSSSKTQVLCNASLPLPDGGIVVIDYSFYWQGSQANIRYSVARQ